MKVTEDRVYEAVCKDLQEFGYPSTTPAMVRDVHKAMRRGDKRLPHGVVGAFAKPQIEDAIERGLLGPLPVRGSRT